MLSPQRRQRSPSYRAHSDSEHDAADWDPRIHHNHAEPLNPQTFLTDPCSKHPPLSYQRRILLQRTKPKSKSRLKKTASGGTSSNKRYGYLDPGDDMDASSMDDWQDTSCDETEHAECIPVLNEVNILDLVKPERMRQGIGQDFQIIPRPRKVLFLEETDEETLVQSSFPSISSTAYDNLTDWHIVLASAHQHDDNVTIQQVSYAAVAAKRGAS